MILGFLAGRIVEDRFGHPGVEFLGTETVASSVHRGHIRSLDRAACHGFGDCGLDVHIQRLAQGAGFLGSIQYADRTHLLGKLSDEGCAVEGAVEPYFDQPHLLTLLGEVIDDFMHGFRRRSHHHDHMLGIRSAFIVEQVILSPRDLGKSVHRFLYDCRCLEIIRIDGLATLEEDIRVLRRSPNRGSIGREPPSSVRQHPFVIDHGAHVVMRQLFDLVNLMGGAETIKEMHEGHARFQRCGLSDECIVHHFLDAVRGQQTPTR